MTDCDSDQETRQIGRHTFIFSKEDSKGENVSPTIVASPIAVGITISQDLPLEFLNYMRALFDILDERATGFIKLTDIEAHWDIKQGQGGLPPGIVESLRKVTPKSGLLSFERLCTGFKLAFRSHGHTQNHAVTANKRSQSLPHLGSTRDQDWTSDSSEDSFRISDGQEKSQLVEKWRRASLTVSRDGQTGTSSPGMGIKQNSSTKVYFVGKEDHNPLTSVVIEKKYGGLQGGSTADEQKVDKESRLRQIEEEHEILQRGLEVIEKARKWYFKRITAVQEEKLHLQQSDQHSLEQFQYEMLLHKTRREELNLNEETYAHYKASIVQLNDHLIRVLESPLKQQEIINRSLDASSDGVIQQLQCLQQELVERNDRISQLEKEKSALIRDLFNAKASQSEQTK